MVLRLSLWISYIDPHILAEDCGKNVFYSLSVRDYLKKDFISYKQSYWCCWRKLLTYLNISFVDLLELNIDPEWQTISFNLNFIIHPCISYQSCFRLVRKLVLDIEIWYFQLIYTSVVNLLQQNACCVNFVLSIKKTHHLFTQPRKCLTIRCNEFLKSMAYLHSPKKFSNTSACWITRNKHLLEWSQHRKYCMYALQIWHNE